MRALCVGRGAFVWPGRAGDGLELAVLSRGAREAACRPVRKRTAAAAAAAAAAADEPRRAWAAVLNTQPAAGSEAIPPPRWARRLASAAAAAATAAALALGAADAATASNALAAAEPAAQCPRPGLGILSLPLSSDELPTARPPPWAGQCGWACALDAPPPAAAPNGALTARVEHRPLAGVTPEMLVWWFGNIEGEMTHPVDGRSYPKYLVWHPRDHITTSTASPGRGPGDPTGARWRIVEFFGARRDWLRGDAPCEWADQFFTNTTLTVRAFGAGGMEGGFPLPWRREPAVRLVHEWSPSPEGARLVSTLTVGVPQGDDPGTRLVNFFAKRAFGGREPEAALRAWQLHCLQEFGNLKFFLPELYASSSGEGSGGSGAA
ncbi:hypothetical protein Rsub_08433 [Raphidocelis subcapitata]|uniref:Uncharacterized protein n=1 Tax=Raphidocelis subcapitata TaxID=307507 RepID=A0A2V0PD61_9CHLO|nr:hypothetical protein Rsub_08433 [Raphidocelis subcapitata]|eukprot:GBF95843.1 hypothetical protein Rsub_08433 [Raphidocelis subcapitata]